MKKIMILISVLILLQGCGEGISILQSGYDYEAGVMAGGIEKERVNECITWALGDDWQSLPLYKIDDRLWGRYGSLFGIEGHWPMEATFKRIGEVCVKQLPLAIENEGKRGEIYWENGLLNFKGNIDESARIFFEYFWKDYINPGMKAEELAAIAESKDNLNKTVKQMLSSLDKQEAKK